MDMPSRNGSQPSEPQDGYINKRAVYVTIGICVGAAIFVQLVFLATDVVNGQQGFSTAGWQPRTFESDRGFLSCPRHRPR